MFTHHFVEMSALSLSQLQDALQERHIKEERVHLFYSLKTRSDTVRSNSSARGSLERLNEGVLQSAIKPPKRLYPDYDGSLLKILFTIFLLLTEMSILLKSPWKISMTFLRRKPCLEFCCIGKT